MDKDELKEAVANRLENLQPEIRNAIMDSNYEKNLYEISQKFKLNIEQMSQLEIATTLVLLGQTHPDGYIDDVIEEVKVPKDVAEGIVNDVNEKILKNIRDLIKKNFEEDKAEDEAQSEVPLPPYDGIGVADEDSSNKEELNEPVVKINKSETGIYKNAGIEMISDEPKEDPLSKIANKLIMPTSSKPIVSDHTMPKVTPAAAPVAPAPTPTPAQNTNKHDPYHEVIE